MPDLIKKPEQIFTTSTCSHNKFLQSIRKKCYALLWWKTDDTKTEEKFSIFVISYPGYIIISGAPCLSDHVWNDLYLVYSRDFFDCMCAYLLTVQIRRVEIQSWRLLSLLYAPSSCLIKAV